MSFLKSGSNKGEINETIRKASLAVRCSVNPSRVRDRPYTKVSSEHCFVKNERYGVVLICDGPDEGLAITLTTGGDWDHIEVKIGAQTYSLWEQIVATGSMAGLKGDLIEWIGKKTEFGRTERIGLIVRLGGSSLNEDGLPGRPYSHLAVYGITDDSMCFKGFVRGAFENQVARDLAISGECLETMTPEKL